MNKVLLIDKPASLSSFDVIRKLRKLTGIKKMGHAGTLDPFATGLLPVFLDKATRFAQYFLHDDKTYLAELCFGAATNTADNTGEITEQAFLPIVTPEKTKALVQAVLAIEKQTPPIYSAIKVNGKRSYALAREGKEVILEERPAKVFSFEIVAIDSFHCVFKAEVGKGFYLRTLGEFIAEFLGTAGYLTSLQRIALGSLDYQRSIPLALVTEDNWQNYLMPIDEILPQFSVVFLETALKGRFLNGNGFEFALEKNGSYLVKDEENEIIGLADYAAPYLNPKLVIK